MESVGPDLALVLEQAEIVDMVLVPGVSVLEDLPHLPESDGRNPLPAVSPALPGTPASLLEAKETAPVLLAPVR